MKSELPQNISSHEKRQQDNQIEKKKMTTWAQRSEEAMPGSK